MFNIVKCDKEKIGTEYRLQEHTANANAREYEDF